MLVCTFPADAYYDGFGPLQRCRALKRMQRGEHRGLIRVRLPDGSIHHTSWFFVLPREACTTLEGDRISYQPWRWSGDRVGAACPDGGTINAPPGVPYPNAAP